MKFYILNLIMKEEDEMLNNNSFKDSPQQSQRASKSSKEDSCCVRSFQFFILNLTFLLNVKSFFFLFYKYISIDKILINFSIGLHFLLVYIFKRILHGSIEYKL